MSTVVWKGDYRCEYSLAIQNSVCFPTEYSRFVWRCFYWTRNARAQSCVCLCLLNDAVKWVDIHFALNSGPLSNHRLQTSNGREFEFCCVTMNLNGGDVL